MSKTLPFMTLVLFSVLGADSHAQSSTEGPLVLVPMVGHEGLYTTGRERLPNGDIVQYTSGCSEWAGGSNGCPSRRAVLDDRTHVHGVFQAVSTDQYRCVACDCVIDTTHGDTAQGTCGIS